MKKALRFCFVLFLFFRTEVFAQFIGDNEISSSQLSSWKSNDKSDYVGYYKFGFSESESTLLITNYEKCEAKLLVSEYNSNTDHWESVTKKLTNVSIKNGRFSSNQITGKFVYYFENGQKYKGLQILNTWQSLGKLEVGLLLKD